MRRIIIQMILNLNNNIVNIESDKDETLLSVLRNENITSVKCGCTKGMCGSCTVLINNKPVPSCLVPIGSLTNQNIVTLEHFSLTEEFDDIIQGLDKANVKLCGFCNAGKIFAIHDIINQNENPNRSDIIRRMRTFSCLCVSIESLIEAIFKAFDIRLEREGHLEYGRK